MGGDMRHLFFIACLIFSSYSYSDNYQWFLGTSNPSIHNGPYSSLAELKAANPNWTYGPKKHWWPEMVASAQCFLSTLPACPWDGYITHISRVGTTCPDGQPLDPETQDCPPPEPPNECEAKTGQETRFSMAGQAPDDNYGVNNGNLFPKTRHACIGSCLVELASSPCKTWASGHYKCSGLAFFTGQQCGSESQVEGTASDTTPEVEKTDIPCKYETVNGVQVCTSQKTVDKQGKSCGQVNGQDVCIDKQPERDDVKIETTVKTEPTPDGGSKTTTKNEATVTKCQGINNCRTTTTTTTKTETKDASGNTTDSKTICTGPHCGSGGDDEDGDGLGDCIGPSCAEVRPGGQGSGEGEGFGDVMGYGDALDAFMGRVKNSPLGHAVSGIAVPGGGSCSMPSRSIPIIGSVSAQGMCDLAHVLDGLRFVFLALFGFAAVRVVMSA